MGILLHVGTSLSLRFVFKRDALTMRPKKRSHSRAAHSRAAHSRAGKYLSHPAVKTAGILVIASAVGISVAGPERSGAIAAEMLPKFSLNKVVADTPTPAEQRVHHFSMSVVSGRSTIPALAPYQKVEVEIVAKGVEPLVILHLQKTGRHEPVQSHERAVSEVYFSEIWQRLRDLETAQLTDLSPYTENLDKADHLLSSFNTASATYRFQFKDGVYDYPNSFEVHAPEHLKDSRYQALRDLAFLVLDQSFGDVL